MLTELSLDLNYKFFLTNVHFKTPRHIFRSQISGILLFHFKFCIVFSRGEKFGHELIDYTYKRGEYLYCLERRGEHFSTIKFKLLITILT
jgi:hypothetical protein